MATDPQVREIKALLGELSDRISDLSQEKRKELMDEGNEFATTVRDRFSANLHAARNKAREMSDRANQTKKQADEYAHEKPWNVAAGAAVAGIVLGMILSGKKKFR